MVHRLGRGRPLSALLRWRPDQLGRVAAYVAEVTRADLPRPENSPAQPLAAFFRRRDRPLGRASADSVADPVERARAAIDLATVSVLLDAGAGVEWHYRERATGLRFPAPKGLPSQASGMFQAGGFSSDGAQSLRADSDGACGHRRRRRSRATSRSTPAIRWSGLNGARSCCASSATRWPPDPICLGARPRGRAIWPIISCGRQQTGASTPPTFSPRCLRGWRRSGRPG